MIPRDYISEWRDHAPWLQDFQVEQDLVISRAIIEIFLHPLLRTSLAFRGGTALYKLYILPPARYSEDIDLVQLNPEPIGPVMDALRTTLGPWLGKPQWKQTKGRVTFYFRFKSEDTPPLPLRLKVEINSREHFTEFERASIPFSVTTRWFTGSADIHSYALDELLGTKLRALYQRRKGRDLFDLATALKNPAVDAARVIEAFLAYMEKEGRQVSRALFEKNLAEKRTDELFAADINPILANGYQWDLERAMTEVSSKLIALLPGEPWKGDNENG